MMILAAMANENSLTPMMEQYFKIKDKNRDAILFFRLGDFYEMFYEDARLVSSILDIALTSRQKVPMCGVPYHAANSYITKLLRLGYKVAICEQVEDPAMARGIVKREVVKVLTPGTALEIEIEEARESTVIAALEWEKNTWGLAFLDLSAGELKSLEGNMGDEKQLWDELFKIYPKEIIFSEKAAPSLKDKLNAHGLSSVSLTPVDSWLFEFYQASKTLKEHFEVESLAGFGLEGKQLAVSVAGGLLSYVKKIRQDSLKVIRNLSYLQAGASLILDSATVRNLELVRNLQDGKIKGTLLEVMDFTITPMGGRLLKSWLLRPSNRKEEIENRLASVAEALEATITRSEIRKCLKEVQDLDRLIGKISLKAAQPRDLVALKNSLKQLPRLEQLLDGLKTALFEESKSNWDRATDVVEHIEEAILDEPAFILTEGGIIKDGFNHELDDLRKISRSGMTFIAQLESEERARTGINSLKVRFNRVMGYYIEVSKPNLHLIPSDYIRKQTLVSSERFLTPELKEYEEKVLHAKEKINQLEFNLFVEVRNKVALETNRLQLIARRLALLDVLFGLAELAAKRNYTRPTIREDDIIRIEEGRHPVVEVSLGTESFIPNDAYLDRESHQILIITGPNMGGKSTYLRQVGLIALMAQMGSFVPAKTAEIGLVDRIFTRIGAMDFLNIGQSTFMVEMLETANILHNSTAGSLILLDEVGRGTSTFDGLSIAWAVAEFLHEGTGARPRTLFATHYHELTELAQTMSRIKNYQVAVREWQDSVVFLKKIIPGPSDRSYGIHVAKLAGLPKSVLDRAREILINLEKLELSESGPPRFAYNRNLNINKDQLLLFPAEREMAVLKEIAEELNEIEIACLTPLEALSLLARLQNKIKDNQH